MSTFGRGSLTKIQSQKGLFKALKRKAPYPDLIWRDLLSSSALGSGASSGSSPSRVPGNRRKPRLEAPLSVLRARKP